MTEPQSSKHLDDDVKTQARIWFLKKLQTWTSADEARFRLWLDADPAHRKAFELVDATWQATEQPGTRIAAADADDLSGYLQAMDRAKSRKKARRGLAATSMLLIALLAAGLWLERPNLWQNLAADYATNAGERRNITLSDGTNVLLDADSALDEQFTKDERRVTLLRGSAFFDVAAGERPFVVVAANGEIRDIGTRFDVNLLDDGGVVTLESGQVSVATGDSSRQVLLDPGQRVRFGSSGIGAIEVVDLKDALAWHGGRYIFYRTRLADVAAEIGRYRNGRIVIVGSALADQLVTGSFSLNDTDAALGSLQSSVGFRMTDIGGTLTIISP
ncbi:DUF4880 domain-containing protein [Rhizobium lusitanum]|uniref:DUF4880 domain-containing protein n=1 Tax=Rhizobium lusitanum TaxID=293958 RepID=A0A6L9UDG9_9HYPH|nr:FecR domain-containing protein [Rhizobium lusitanum]NEI72227.1 DUF4880 domain-containing protein [Rhizobium lusitanum]